MLAGFIALAIVVVALGFMALLVSSKGPSAQNSDGDVPFFRSWRRSGRWKDEAHRRGYLYESKVNLRRFPFDLFGWGEGCEVRSAVVKRTKHSTLYLADVMFTIKGKNQSGDQRRCLTVAVVERPGFSLPAFTLSTSPLASDPAKYSKRSQVFLGQVPAFTGRYGLVGDEPAPVQAYFTPQRQQEMMSLRSRPLYVEACGEAILVHFDKDFEPVDTPPLVEWALSLRDVLSTDRGAA